MRRTLAIDEASFGPDHPAAATTLQMHYGTRSIMAHVLSDYERAGLHPRGSPAARLADETVGRRQRRGLDAMTPDEINAEIASHRHEKESAGRESK
jgi:hypothetical protein